MSRDSSFCRPWVAGSLARLIMPRSAAPIDPEEAFRTEVLGPLRAELSAAQASEAQATEKLAARERDLDHAVAQRRRVQRQAAEAADRSAALEQRLEASRHAAALDAQRLQRQEAATEVAEGAARRRA